MSKVESSKYVRNPSIRRLSSLRAGITLIWLTSRVLMSENDIEIVTRLQGSYDYSFLYYTKTSKAFKYMNGAKSCEYLIVVIDELDLQTIEAIFNQCEENRQIRTILMVNNEKKELDSIKLRAEVINKIVICRERDSLSVLLQHLLEDATQHIENDDNFITYNANEKALRDVRHELGAFAWGYSNVLILSEMPYNSIDTKEQFLKECRAIYQGNSVQLTRILEFEQTYQAYDAIHWYTKPYFLFRIINRALRSGDALILFKLRYFIVDMCKDLENTAAMQSSLTTHVYRGAILAKEEVEKLKVGSLIAANSFFSSSLNLRVAQSFINIDPSTGMSPSSGRNDRRQFVLFEIEIDPVTMHSADVIATNVSLKSAIPEEEEVIFGLGTTFVITMTEYNIEHKLWNIKMDVSTEAAAIKREHKAFISGSLRNMTAICLFGSRLADIWGQYTQASAYFQDLLRTLPADHIDRPLLLYHLGRVYRFLGKFERAITYLRCAELFQRRLMPQSTLEYGSTLGALGATYSEVGDSKRAVRLHERAIAVHSGHLPKYDREMAFHANRLAYACFQEKQYERVFSILNDIEIIFKPRMPAAHPALAQVVHTRGLVHQALGNSERAIDCMKETLGMRELWLNKDHPAVARTCYQLAFLHEECHEYTLAFEYAERALHIQQVKLPETHQERKWSQELVERLRSHIHS